MDKTASISKKWKIHNIASKDGNYYTIGTPEKIYTADAYDANNAYLNAYLSTHVALWHKSSDWEKEKWNIILTTNNDYLISKFTKGSDSSFMQMSNDIFLTLKSKIDCQDITKCIWKIIIPPVLVTSMQLDTPVLFELDDSTNTENNGKYITWTDTQNGTELSMSNIIDTTTKWKIAQVTIKQQLTTFYSIGVFDKVTYINSSSTVEISSTETAGKLVLNSKQDNWSNQQWTFDWQNTGTVQIQHISDQSDRNYLYLGVMSNGIGDMSNKIVITKKPTNWRIYKSP
jgi:hypothetical protein